MAKNFFSNATTAQAVAEMQRAGDLRMKRMAALWISLDAERRAKLEKAFKPDFDKCREAAAKVAAFTPNLAQRAALDVAAGDARN